MASFGETLKRERELREISLRQISEATKINIRYLEALEQNQFDLLPGGLFNKGFIRAYATYIGVDGEMMVNTYLHEITARGGGAPDNGRNAGLHRPAEVPQRRAGPAGARDASPPAPPETPPIPSSAPEPAPRPPAATETARALRFATQPPPVAADALSSEASGEERTTGARVLFWVLVMVVGAGIVFVMLNLLSDPERTSPIPSPASPSDEDAVAPGALHAGPSEPAPGEPRIAAPIEPSASAPAGPGPEPVSAATPPPERRPAAAAGLIAPPEPTPAPDRPAERGTRMEVTLEATDLAWVQLACDGRVTVDRMMRAGDRESAECLSIVRISATDAGVVRLTVNGAPCLPLGDPGARAYGYTIRSDDFERICRPRERGDDGR